MRFSLSNRVLRRGILAGAVVLTGTACSRSDRTESGSDTTAAILPDTSSNAAQPYGADTATGAVSDTATPSRPSSTQPYRPMERDTTNVPASDSARVTADTAKTSSTPSLDTSVSAIPESADTGSIEMAGASDTTTAAQVEMARDTSTVPDQVDTAAAPSGVVAVQTTTDTTSPADTTADASRIYPPEDSTRVLAVERVTDDAVDETADEQIIVSEDEETVATSETRTDEVGAAAIGGEVTGADAVALLSREGVRCALVDFEANEAARWDMSSTPVTLNPCGMGSMVLSRIWTAGQQGSGAAGQ
jgi:hypothetical protein